MSEQCGACQQGDEHLLMIIDKVSVVIKGSKNPN